MSRVAVAPAACALIVWAATIAGAAHQSAAREPSAEDWSAYLPPGEGKALVARHCAACHTLEGSVKLRATKQAWEAVVFDMVARGAPLMLEEVDPIVGYLAAAFGPATPPFVDANTATVDELLKLPGVTPALARQVIEHRQVKGPFLSRDDFRAALGMAEPAFEKIKWYVRVQGPASVSR